METHSGHAVHQPYVQSDSKTHAEHAAEAPSPYRRFGVELAADFVVMFLVMYTMIAGLGHFYFNVNNVYMTLMMVAPMAILMLISMRSMFPNRRRNMVIIGGAAFAFIASFAAMRTQAGVGDEQFLRSMIPHHSGAILMCQEASLTDPQVIALCKQIVTSQQEEIATMQAMLARR